VQAIQKEHGLDNYEKVKRESVLEMVRRFPLSLVPNAGHTACESPLLVSLERGACSREEGGTAGVRSWQGSVEGC
jgi:hypothetical protein